MVMVSIIYQDIAKCVYEMPSPWVLIHKGDICTNVLAVYHASFFCNQYDVKFLMNFLKRQTDLKLIVKVFCLSPYHENDRLIFEMLITLGLEIIFLSMFNSRRYIIMGRD